MPLREHGGVDAQGQVPWDFSTNSNACGPCPLVLKAVQCADATRYPDPSYQVLREELAGFHHVSPQRVLLCASASEAIQRITAGVVRQGGHTVCIPHHAYGDYANAASAWGMSLVRGQACEADGAQLQWLCDPNSPTGQTVGPNERIAGCTVVLDRAYEPLRLLGKSAWAPENLNHVWQLWSPNKALGLTGVRGAYLIAPLDANAMVALLHALAPSWPVGAHALAMLSAWTRNATQTWVAQARKTLLALRTEQESMLLSLGWELLPSVTAYVCGRPPASLNVALLREQGIKLRDTTNMGLPGYFRLSVQPPPAQVALKRALQNQINT